MPIGKASVVREGADATLVTYGVGVQLGPHVADVFHDTGFRVEVIDLRSLLPWDVETVIASVRKTHRALVVHEAPLTGGFGGEVAATIAEQAFEWLDAPVMRVGSLDTPVPAAKELERIFEPKERLEEAVRRLLHY